jgi:hypothetical protein
MRRFSTMVAGMAVVLAACATAPAASPSIETSADQPTSAKPSSSDGPSAEASDGPSPAAEPSPEPLAWSELPATGPSAREDHTWTVDGEGTTAYLFGGRDGSTAFGDTWAYDLTTDTWTELRPAASPPARFGHEAVWADGVGLVIFAGQAGATFFDDLWAYDPTGSAWRQLPSMGAVPTARYGTCAGIAPDGRLWISHGFTSDGIRFFDTRAYAFESGTWTDETPGGDHPVERCLHGCWWTDDGGFALYGGQTTGTTALDDRWILHDGRWARVEGTAPGARNLYARARGDQGTLIFGGQALDGGYLADLWLMADDGAAVPQEPAGPGPAGRAGGELVTDPARGRALLFGGRTADGALDDIWQLGGL